MKIRGRLLWNERSARLKLVLPCEGRIQYDVPGGKVYREQEGQVPGGRWAVRSTLKKHVGFASDVLGDFDATPGELRVTLARATRYATDVCVNRDEYVSQPIVDCGELKFNLCLFGDAGLGDQAANTLLNHPTVMIAPATRGDWGVGVASDGSDRIRSDY